MESDISNYRINDMQRKIKIPPLDIMLVGVTGAGKSSTIDSLLGKESAKIGRGTNPETKEIQSYRLNKYIELWDTPGFGDSPEEDAKHLNAISEILDPNCLFTIDGCKYRNAVDMVIVVIDGSRKDLGVIYPVLNKVIFKSMGVQRGTESKRVLFIINQADMAMKGRHWDSQNETPDGTLSEFLREQALSIQKRIEDNTGYKICTPLCYSATNNFNTKELIDFILENIPNQRKKLLSKEDLFWLAIKMLG